MTFLPRFRTILTAIIAGAVALVGGSLSALTYFAMLENMRDFANDLATEISEGSRVNFETTVEHSEKGIRLAADFFATRVHNPTFPALATTIYRGFAFSAEKNHALLFAEPVRGNGIIIREGEIEIVDPDGKGGYLARSTFSGNQRMVPDMRESDWFKAGMDLSRSGGTGWLALRKFNSLRGLKELKALSLYHAVPDIKTGGKPAGVLALAISPDWIRNNLVESLGKQNYPATAFILEFNPGESDPSLMVHTNPAINQMIANNEDRVLASNCGCETTAAIARKLTDGHLVENKSHQFQVYSDNQMFHATHTTLKSAEGTRWILCHFIPDWEITHPARQKLATNLAVTAVVLAGVLGLAIWFSLRVAKPIERLTLLAEATGRLDLTERKLDRSAILEINRLSEAVDSMRAGLKSFLRFIPEELIRRYLKPGSTAGLDSEVVPVTIVFSDIRDFSSVAERTDPLTLVRHLNEYLEIISGIAYRHGGTVDKYIGDAVMVFWNAPVRVPNHAREAFTAVLDAKKALLEAQQRWKSAGLPVFNTRVGINTGAVIVGNIGSSVRLNYTIIGDPVNLASRLENLNKQYGTTILASDRSKREAGDEFLTRPVDLVAVKGKSEPVMVHELMGRVSECGEDETVSARLTAEAYQFYHDRRFVEATTAYAEILERWPADTLARTMMERAREYTITPPPEGWSGVHRASIK